MSPGLTNPPAQRDERAVATSDRTLTSIDNIAHIQGVLRAKWLLCLRGDFLGHARASAFLGLPGRFDDGWAGGKDQAHMALAEPGRTLDFPMLCIAASLTNPFQKAVDLRLVVDHVKLANAHAVILIEAAHADLLELRRWP